MDGSPPGSSIHGISQARILEWVTTSFSRASSWPRNWTWISFIAGGFLTVWATREALGAWIKSSYLFLIIHWWSCEFQGEIRANHATLELGAGHTGENSLRRKYLKRSLGFSIALKANFKKVQKKMFWERKELPPNLYSIKLSFQCDRRKIFLVTHRLTKLSARVLPQNVNSSKDQSKRKLSICWWALRLLPYLGNCK